MKWSDTPSSIAPKVYGKYADGRSKGMDDNVSIAPKVYGKYADGRSKGMDDNVFAGGYRFPEY